MPHDPVLDALAAIHAHRPGFSPHAAMILGSGLGILADELDDRISIPYGELDGFPLSTVAGHGGELVLGRLQGVEVACMKGRGHFYEHETMKVMTTPVRVFKKLGCDMLLVTNAAGSLRPERIGVGSLVAISDHINLMPGTPLTGANDEAYGPRFFSMANAYDKGLRAEILATAKEIGITLNEGVYVACSGPCFETAAEIRMMQIVGGDVVGMSTIPEVIAAAHCALPILAISAITNLAEGLGNQPLSHEQTLRCAGLAEADFLRLIRALIRRRFQLT